MLATFGVVGGRVKGVIGVLVVLFWIPHHTKYVRDLFEARFGEASRWVCKEGKGRTIDLPLLPTRNPFLSRHITPRSHTSRSNPQQFLISNINHAFLLSVDIRI